MKRAFRAELHFGGKCVSSGCIQHLDTAGRVSPGHEALRSL